MIEASPLVLTDGGLETRIVYEFHRELPDFAAVLLLDDAAGREILRQIYDSYADVAKRYALPMQIGTPTWRASERWMNEPARRNREAVAFVRDVVARSGASFVIAGVIGPAHDGYSAAAALGEEEAYRYHRDQAGVLAQCGVDLLYAPTFPSFSELCGAARAMGETGVPYALAPMLHPDGTMLDGTPMATVVATIDARAGPRPDHYMIGCLYPTLAGQALAATRALDPVAAGRVRGLKANASPLSTEELDKLDRLAATPPDRFALDLWACAREFELTILGGCCGTDARDIEAIAAMR